MKTISVHNNYIFHLADFYHLVHVNHIHCDIFSFTFLSVSLLYMWYHINQAGLDANRQVDLFHHNSLFLVTLKLSSYHNNIVCICPCICMCSLKVSGKR